MEQIQKEYADVCAQAGHLQYQIGVLQGELKKINEKLLSLNEQAARLKQGTKNE